MVTEGLNIQVLFNSDHMYINSFSETVINHKLALCENNTIVPEQVSTNRDCQLCICICNMFVC